MHLKVSEALSQLMRFMVLIAYANSEGSGETAQVRSLA